MGTARLEPERCWAVQGQPCDYCIKECPLGEKALRWSNGRPEIVEDVCTGCGMCVHICTATPSALSVERSPVLVPPDPAPAISPEDSDQI